MVYNTNKKSLVFGLNLKGEIIQFDLECQKITGYSRSDVINKKIDEFLIPLSYIGKWRNIFDLIKNNKNVSDFEIPWLKSDGAEILLTWNSETIVDNDGSLKQILFIGKNKKFSDTYIIKNKSEKKFEDNYKFNNVKSNVSKNEIETNFYKESKKNINELVKSKNIKLDNLDTRQLLPPPLRKKRIVFEKDGKTIYFEASSLLESEKKSKIKKEESHNDSMVNKQFLSSYNKTDEQSKPVKIYKNDKKVIDIIKKYDMLNNKLIELEKKDRKLERKNKMLEKNLKNLRLYLKKNNMIISVRDSERFEIGNQKIKNEDYSKIKLKNVFYPFRIKKRHKEFEIKRIELENRAKELDKLEAKLINDRKTHDKKIA